MGKQFDSSKEALEAAQTDIDAALSTIRPVAEPLGGSAKLVIPSRELLRKTEIQTTGRPRSKLIDYLVEALHLQVRAQADGLVRSRLFNAVRVVESSDAGDPTIGDFDYLIWHRKAKGWYLMRARGSERGPILIDPDTAVVDRLQAWVASVHQAARE